jgi:hypothetical protein
MNDHLAHVRAYLARADRRHRQASEQRVTATSWRAFLKGQRLPIFSLW